MKKINQASKECEACGVRLMNKEVRFCTPCGKAHQKKIRTNLILFSLAVILISTGLLYLTEYFHASAIWKFVILIAVMAIIPITMNKIRKS